MSTVLFATEPCGAGRLARITLNRPDARNALNNAMCLDLLAAVRQAAEMPDLACVLVAADGPAFCAGADLKERSGMDDDQIRGRRLRAFRAYDAIEGLAMPTIAVVGGACIGSGCEIAAACDFIIAGQGASFRYPETQRGTVGATQRLSRIVGRRLAKELLFTGRALDAAEARAIGLVNRVVPDDALQAAADELAAQICRAPVAALRQTKQAIDRGADDSRHGALAHEILAIEENLETASWRAGMTAGPGSGAAS
ncbi:enoyl-CoA hydratase/isomerase family protein [Marinibaculum pumilum]|uniref:Enoyl-CoA hydratase/isomerase family protein n=1 Tax=Marinibaculum pumilum TaxID=1766165 RepID=A0ABV7L3Q1_9PROT